jgi:catechol 1,2-dioxygenase
VPSGGATERLLGAVGRHGRRPAHIHFFVSAQGFRHLTTQVNIDGDPDLYDDFAYATRDGLIAKSPAVSTMMRFARWGSTRRFRKSNSTS